MVPYPVPSSPAATAVGKANKRKDSRAEVRLRSALHRRGFRFRKDLLVRAGGLRVHVDVAFTRRQLAVFVDGCFWHGCPLHRYIPRTNCAYWAPKLSGNEVRDRRVDEALGQAGWDVLRIWEHVAMDEAVELVAMRYGMAPGCIQLS